jgi:hypothetical protein
MKPENTDSTDAKLPESPSIDVEKIVAERVAQAMSAREAKEADIRKRAQLRASVVASHLNGKHELAEYLPDVDDEEALKAAAMKIRKAFLYQSPDIGGATSGGGTPPSRITAVDRSMIPAGELIAQRFYRSNR